MVFLYPIKVLLSAISARKAHSALKTTFNLIGNATDVLYVGIAIGEAWHNSTAGNIVKATIKSH